MDLGCDINARGGEYGNSLQAAAWRGNEATGGSKIIIRLLLDQKANVNAQGGRYGNALQAAEFGGNEGVACLLLERGADVNTQGGENGNAPQASMSNDSGDEEVNIHPLLDPGADISNLKEE